MMHRWQTTFVIEGPKFIVKKVWWRINDEIWYVVKAASSLFHNDGTRKTSWNWFFWWRRNLHHLTVFAFAMRPKNVTGHPDPRVPSTLLGAVPAAHFGNRQTRGGLAERHVSTCQEPPGSATCRFPACPLFTWEFGHLSLHICDTCPLVNCPRGTK